MAERRTDRSPPTFRAIRETFVEAITADDDELIPTKITADDANDFSAKVVKSLNRCTEDNVRECAKFITQVSFASPRRTYSLMVFLVETGKLLGPKSGAHDAQDSGSRFSSTHSHKRCAPLQSKRWHLLVIINAAIKAHFHGRSDRRKDDLLRQMLPQLTALIRMASFSDSLPPQHLTDAQARLQNIISAWMKFSPAALSRSQTQQLRIAAIEGQRAPSWRSILKTIALAEQEQQRLHPFADDPEWKMPSTHNHPGAENVPDFELPAANGLFMKRVHGWPIQSRALPESGYQLSSAGKKVDADLIETVEDMYSRAIRCFDKYTNADEVRDIDPMGNIIWQDDTRPTTTHWGWPIQNVEKRKRLAQQFHQLAVGYSGVQSRPPHVTRGSAPSNRSRGDYGGHRAGSRSTPRVDIQADIARAQRLANGQGGAAGGFDGGSPWRGGSGRGGSYRGRGNNGYSRGNHY